MYLKFNGKTGIFKIKVLIGRAYQWYSEAMHKRLANLLYEVVNTRLYNYSHVSMDGRGER